jgi:outer membrane protein OmpA-like peptidoglycan-associated protein
MRSYRTILAGLTGLFMMVGGAVRVTAQTQEDIPAASVISRSIKAIGYQVGSSTKVDFDGTTAAPGASGEAKVSAKTGVTNIEVQATGLPSPSTIGTEFLTYVLWAITQDGRTANLGEIQIDKNGEGKLKATTQLAAFAMIVTAEPYFAVRIPSEVVVLENDTRKNTKGKIYPDNSYKLMLRNQYAKLGNPLALTLDLKTTPLEMYEARNAVDIAKSQRAPEFAPDIFAKAESSLQMAENSLASKADKKKTISEARQAVQFAEDSRALSAQKQEALRIKNEREAAAAAAAAKAKAAADEQAAIEARRQAELTAAKQAQMQAQADLAAANAKAAADAAAAKSQAEQDALRAKEEAAKAEAERAQRDAAALRAQLLEQFNRVLETTDTPRGLVVNMADVLFDFGKYNLKSEAREKLAKLSGIILAHPGLHLAVEGYTDNVGSDDFNMKLSDQRASTVRDYLITQGLSADSVSAEGLGKSMPVADNATPAGRQKNRRVEIIVSGEVIGQKIGK